MSDDIAKSGGDGGQEPLGSEVSQVAGSTTLKRNVLSMPEVLAQSVANMAPSAALALLPLLVFLNAGNGAWLSFLVAVILMACVGYCVSSSRSGWSRRARSTSG